MRVVLKMLEMRERVSERERERGEREGEREREEREREREREREGGLYFESRELPKPSLFFFFFSVAAPHSIPYVNAFAFIDIQTFLPLLLNSIFLSFFASHFYTLEAHSVI